MIQGTTPTHTFTVPFNCDDVKNVEVTYKQNDTIVLQKYIGDCHIDGNIVSVDLTQEDTFKFVPKVNVKIQVRALDAYGKIRITKRFEVYCEECLACEVLT